MAAFATDYDYDLFLSYSHLDNKRSGWIDTLQKLVEDRVGEILGETIQLWRDANKLNGLDLFDAKIAHAVSRSAVFLAVVSPRYVKSESCINELRAFHTTHTDPIATKSRIGRVMKTPLLTTDVEPPELRSSETLGFEFFERQPGAIVEFENRDTHPTYQKFEQQAFRLARAVAELLQIIREGSAQPQTTSKLDEFRERRKNELEGRSDKRFTSEEERQRFFSEFVRLGEEVKDLRGSPRVSEPLLALRRHLSAAPFYFSDEEYRALEDYRWALHAYASASKLDENNGEAGKKIDDAMQRLRRQISDWRP